MHLQSTVYTILQQKFKLNVSKYPLYVYYVCIILYTLLSVGSRFGPTRFTPLLQKGKYFRKLVFRIIQNLDINSNSITHYNNILLSCHLSKCIIISYTVNQEYYIISLLCIRTKVIIIAQCMIEMQIYKCFRIRWCSSSYTYCYTVYIYIRIRVQRRKQMALFEFTASPWDGRLSGDKRYFFIPRPASVPLFTFYQISSACSLHRVQFISQYIVVLRIIRLSAAQTRPSIQRIHPFTYTEDKIFCN